MHGVTILSSCGSHNTILYHREMVLNQTRKLDSTSYTIHIYKKSQGGEYSDNQQWPPPFGINNIGDFLWQEESTTTEKPTTAGELQETGQPGQPGAGGLTPQSTNRRMIAFITALVVIAVLIATIVALVIALCCKLKKEGAPKHQDHELEELS